MNNINPELPVERVHSACPHDCPSTCALEVERIDENTIGRVYGARDNRYTAGTLCAKVARYAERIHHPDRLLKPMIRRSSHKAKGASGSNTLDAFEPVSWDSALSLTAEKFADLSSRFGAETIWPYYFAGTMGLINRDGINRLRHVLGYSRQQITICTTLPEKGWLAGVGVLRGVDPSEMRDSDLVVVWGGNPVHTQVNLMQHITNARRQNNAPLVVVDVYNTPTAQKADLALILKPGTDAALACAVMHILFRDGYADREYLSKHTDASSGLEEHLATRGPQWAADITGLSVADIEKFAKLYGNASASFIRAGYGFARSRNGSVSMHAVSCLPAITGAWQHKGGGAHFHNRDLYNIDPSLIQGTDHINTDIRMLDMSRIGPILNGSSQDLGDGPPVTGLFIQNTNPVAVAPESDLVRQGFQRDDLFSVVHEQFFTETAALADVVLPATMFLENDDMFQASGHTFFQVTKPVISVAGECRSNHDVINDLSKRLGGEHPAFEMSARELMEKTLANSGYPDVATIESGHWIDRDLGFETMHFLDGFGQKDGLFHFSPDWAAIGPDHHNMPKLPDHFDVIDKATKARPFRMVTAPARNYLNTSFTETPTSIKREKKPTIKIHPLDAQELGVSNDDVVTVGNDRGEVILHAEIYEGLQTKVVIVESVWPNHAFDGKRGINTLVSADRGYPDGGAVFHDTSVWIKPGINKDS